MGIGLIYLERGRPIVVSGIEGCFQGVYYPYRKTPDLYVLLKDKPAFCAQCQEEFPLEGLIPHIVHHDRRKSAYSRAEGFVEEIVPQ